MARFKFFCEMFFFLFFAPVFPASNFTASTGLSPGDTVAGVFVLMDGDVYAFDFQSANAACLSLNTTMATKGQVERAMQGGLETCKYGWVQDKFAVIPRITANPRCGRGQTGTAVWNAPPTIKFAVFCFNATEEEKKRPLLTWTSSSPTATTGPYKLTTRRPSTLTPTSEETTPTPTPTPSKRSLTTALTNQDKDTTVAHHRQTLITTGTNVSQETSSPPTVLPGMLIIIIIIGGVLLLPLAAALVCYFKFTPSNRWSTELQKDDAGTEMWNHTNGDSDPEDPHMEEEEEEEEEEHEEPDRKFSSDITLCGSRS